MAQQVYSSIYIPRQKFGRYSIQLLRTSSYLLYLIDLCWPSPYQLFNLRSYSTSEETRSEHWVATSILPAPETFQFPCFAISSKRTTRIYSHAGLITYNFHPPFRNVFSRYLPNYLLSSIWVLCDWATRTTTLSYSVITYTSTQTSLLAIPRFETVTS